MKEPILVVLAAGLGSRYGGLKQMDIVGDNSESIIDFSIFDAIEAGFKRVVLIIRRENEEAFQKTLGRKISPFIEVEYAYQDLANIPKPYKVPEGRVKPWGTTHALLSCKALLDAPFMVINADDYYGKEAFRLMYMFLYNRATDYDYCMMGYKLDNTLTEYGTVNRGICQVKDSFLESIVERKRIKRVGGVPCYLAEDNTPIALPADNLVSMNFWGFAPRVLDYLSGDFEQFLHAELTDNPLKCEHVIADSIGNILLTQPYIRVHVLLSRDKWYGITYKEDKIHLMRALAVLKKDGMYPYNLWDHESIVNKAWHEKS